VVVGAGKAFDEGFRYISGLVESQAAAPPGESVIGAEQLAEKLQPPVASGQPSPG